MGIDVDSLCQSHQASDQGVDQHGIHLAMGQVLKELLELQ